MSKHPPFKYTSRNDGEEFAKLKAAFIAALVIGVLTAATIMYFYLSNPN